MSPLRADAERTVHAILEAAEQVLSADPAASMEQIAEQAGVARTTVHRRFATREALIEALAASAVRQIEQAVAASRPRTAPPLVALHQGTANLLGVKLAWRFAVTQISPGSPAARIQLATGQVDTRVCALLALLAGTQSITVSGFVPVGPGAGPDVPAPGVAIASVDGKPAVAGSAAGTGLVKTATAQQAPYVPMSASASGSGVEILFAQPGTLGLLTGAAP